MRALEINSDFFISKILRPCRPIFTRCRAGVPRLRDAMMLNDDATRMIEHRAINFAETPNADVSGSNDNARLAIWRNDAQRWNTTIWYCKSVRDHKRRNVRIPRKLDTQTVANRTRIPRQTGHFGRNDAGSRLGFYSWSGELVNRTRFLRSESPFKLIWWAL